MVVCGRCRIEAGCKAGFLIHTNDLYGLVMSVGSGSGGDVDFWQDEDDDNYKPPFEVRAPVAAMKFGVALHAVPAFAY